MTGSTSSTRPVALWLVVVAFLIFAMVVLGGVTRLTRSGLSIVEWNPVVGIIPPLGDAQWQAEFEKYRLTPEYREVNTGMSLDAFRRIYWVEWAHRLLGRLIGIVFFLPLIYFAIRRRIPASLLPKLIAVFVLGAMQGALGWFMVKSGLVDVPHVSPYRLTAHLALAVAIYGIVLWIVLDMRRPVVATWRAPAVLRQAGWIITGLVYLMILAGGLVAGTKAGFAFNTFPSMNGRFLPPGMFALEPLWKNFFENIATVQFDHRLLAYLLVIVVAGYWWRARAMTLPEGVRRAFHMLLVVLLLQVGLGIATLLWIVPVWLGALHQAGALAVFTVAVYLSHHLCDAA